MIEFIKVSKSFSGQCALDSISFRVENGTACGYIGPNGAGKTTTAKIIVGLEKADAGRVVVSADAFNKDIVEQNSIKREIGYVPESPKLYETLTPTETIVMAALLRGFDRRKAIDRLMVLSEIFLFKDMLRKPLQGLSKGTKQKVVIALALIFDPRILILDEPTDGLDVQSVVSLKRFIKSFTARGGTVFYSSHLLDIVENVCDKVYFINKGSIAGEYTQKDFIGKRGYLENAFIENIGNTADQQLIDAFLANAL